MSHTFRVAPGVSYETDTAGLRDFGRSEVIGGAMLSAAQQLASEASQATGYTFQARRAVTPSGWRNEDRAGAEAYGDAWQEPYRRPHPPGTALARISRTFQMRGGQ